MVPPTALRLVACLGQATLALVSLRASGPLAVPLTLISTDLLIWNFASFAYETSGRPLWNVLDCSTSPFTIAFGLHFVLVFVGRRRSLRHVLIGTYAVCTVLSVSVLAGTSRVTSRFAMPVAVWDRAFLVAIIVVILIGVVLLVAHERQVINPEERQRARLLLAALPLAAVLGATDLMNDLMPVVPRLSQLGTLLCAGFMSAVAFRLRLFGRPVATSTAMKALGLALLGVGAYCIVLRSFSTRTALLVGGAGALTVLLLAITRHLTARTTMRAERMAKLAAVGRVWAQMAHDLKNPLAAVQGAIQFLKEERRQGRSMDEHGEFLDLIGDQIGRMVGILDGYDQVRGVDPARQPVDLGQLVREIAALSEHAGPRITVRTHVVEPLPQYVGDRELLARVLQNLVRNAIEAMPSGGVVTLSAVPNRARRRPDVTLTISDTGEGMDARTRERAFDDFFTTKARGSGLGLAFVRRVVESHGGRISLRSAVGRGTSVSLRLPAV